MKSFKKLIAISITGAFMLMLCACNNTPMHEENCDNGHNLVAFSYTAPTCKTSGDEVKKCSRCGFESKTTLLPVDHSGEIISTVPSTCTTQGSETFTCSMCRNTFINPLPLIDHREILLRSSNSTCVTHGYKVYGCIDCKSNNIRTEELPLIDHNYKAAEVAATCFTKGAHMDKCTMCKDEKNVTETPLLTHDFAADGYCTECGIYKTLFDENSINAQYFETDKGMVVHGNLTEKFNDTAKVIPISYWKVHTITLTLTFNDKYNSKLESHSFTSTTIPQSGQNYGKLTIQNMDESEMIERCSNQFLILVEEGNVFSPETRQKCTSFTIKLSCDGYETIEKTYQVTTD